MRPADRPDRPTGPDPRVLTRRTALTGTAIAAAALLTGCAPGRTEHRINQTAEETEGVTSAQLTLGVGGTFGTILYGDITCDVSAAELEDVLDQAWGAVITLLHDDGGEDDRSVQNVLGRTVDGDAFDVLEWLPERDPGTVTVADFYARYGLG